MALQIAFKDPNDVGDIPAAFAKIAEIFLDFRTRSGTVVVNVYRSKAAYDALLPPISQSSYVFSSSTEPTFDEFLASAIVTSKDDQGTEIFDIARRSLYDFLKTTSSFAEAADVVG